MQKNFSFKGINLSTDSALVQDGECLDIVNLRMSNGSLVPMPQPAMIAWLQKEYSAVFWHEMAEHYIAVSNDGKGVLHFYDKDFAPVMDGDAMLVIEGLSGVKKVEFLGNVVCCLTGSGIHYLLFEKGCYRGLGERPAIPDVNITISSKVEILNTEHTYYKGIVADELESSWNYNEKGYIDECVALLNKAGYYIDRALFRVALRLYDGSYINVSNIFYVSDETFEDGIGRDGNNMLSEPIDTTTTPSKYRVRVRGFKPNFSFDMSCLEKWRNVVVGVDVFSTLSLPGKKCVMNPRVQKYELYDALPINALWNEIASASLYYKVAEYDIDGNRIFSIDDVSSVGLALQQGLETQTVPSSLSSYDVKASFVYNARLHIAAFKEYFFKGYDAVAYIPAATEKCVVDAMLVRVKLRTTQGDFATERYYTSPTLGYDGYTQVLSPILTYPDIRAYEMDIYIKVGETVYGKVFPLVAHKYLNIAYYLHKWYSPYSTFVTAVFANGGKPAAGVAVEDVVSLFNGEVGTHEVIYSASLDSWTYKGEPFPPEDSPPLRVFAIHRNAVNGDKLVFTIRRDGTGDMSFKDIYNIPVDSTWDALDGMPEQASLPYEERRNVLKVSLLENPFVFPAKCTYTPSQSGIVGLSSNTVTLSQGQFGQFPLYVFCNDGIWAMSVDASGSVAYLASNQVSRDVCVNPHSICGIGGGVVFAGKQGVMLIAGNSIKKISLAMNGNANSLSGVPADIFSKISSLVSLECMTGSDDFQDYISNACVSFLPSHNEVLVTDVSRDYSFLYSFVSGMWTRVKLRVTGFVNGNATPSFIVAADGTTRVYAIQDEIAGDNRILLFTRPYIWGTKMPKRIMQLMLHAYAEHPQSVTPNVPLLGLYMLCSNDGVHFKLVAGCEKRSRTQDVLFPYFPTQSYKYYLFAIVGNVGKESVITGIETDVSVPWKNRLR